MKDITNEIINTITLMIGIEYIGLNESVFKENLMFNWSIIIIWTKYTPKLYLLIFFIILFNIFDFGELYLIKTNIAMLCIKTFIQKFP